MGLRYTSYRIVHAIETKIGVLQKRHPANPTFSPEVSLEKWRADTPTFFFSGKNIDTPSSPDDTLKKRVENMKAGKFVLFSKEIYDLGIDFNWVTNPITGYEYDTSIHWSAIPDLSEEMGDIKFVWEKARFSFLTDLLRYDHHYKEDQSEFVINQIIDFIEKNPINCGPNYKCSQEISLRIMNWSLALNYYKDSPNLTQDRFQKIMYAIYWQLHHVYHHINFSRIAVRNNHAITETMMLYLSGLLFPFLPNTKEWSTNGKKWFEKEVEYQVYPDGTFLQYSMNYHRVLVQLLTWGIRLSDLHKVNLSPIVKKRAQLSLEFLDTSMDPVSGKLPNYGNNDGALFFKWTEDDFRIYVSQLNDLRAVINNTVTVNQESQAWYGLNNLKIKPKNIQGIHEFKIGGYYIHQEDSVKTFIRCGAYKDRPSQSDNLHLDIWKDGQNYLWDAGTYKYNTDKETIDFFTGCEGHNTLSVNGENQMLRGSRFIWFNWIKKATGEVSETNDKIVFEGKIEGFKNIGKGIWHSRKVEKLKSKNEWVVKDEVSNTDHLDKKVFWHINPEVLNSIDIECETVDGLKLEPLIEEKWHSSNYGVKEKSIRYTFKSKNTMLTTIKIKD
ncbi:heparinase II/III domain-containing protein [Brumimicrobium oceani]|nr:heparinase II/III family protein [Brumimicrobium oceani]